MNDFSQARALFALDADTVYLDSASVGPTPLAVEAAAREAASAKARPWLRDREAAQAQAPRLRTLAARLIGADASDIAITCAASYGLAVARRNLPLSAGQSVLLLEGDHTSQTLTWAEHARQRGGRVDWVRRPDDGDWTGAILDHLSETDAPTIASLGATYWRDGSHVDLAPVCRALSERGTRIVLDLTQSVGVLDLDLPELRPAFAVFPMYKWLLGPYSLAFLYAAPEWQNGQPLEENSFNRNAAGGYAQGAMRYDMGERDTFVGIPTALAALELAAGWDRSALRAHQRRLTDRLAERLEAIGLQCLPAAARSPHILGVRGLPAGIAAACRQQSVYFTERQGEMRVAVHAFNTDSDVERCVGAVEMHLRKS